MAYIPNSGSVVAFQSDPTKLVGTVSVAGNVFVGGSILTTTPNQSVSGTVGARLESTNASVITVGGGTTGNSSVTAYMGGSWSASVQGILSVLGTVPVTQSGAWTTSLISTTPSSVQVGASVMGTVPVTQTTSPWIINMPSPSVITYQAAGSIMAVSATVNTGNSSVQLLGGVAAIGSVAVLQGTNPWQVNMPSPSVIAYQLAGSIMQVTGGGGGTQYQENNASTPSVTGNAILYKKDETNSVLSAVSPQHPLPVQGSVTTLQGTNPWVINMPSPSVVATQIANSVMGVRTDNASVVAVLSNSSVTALQGTNPWIINQPSPSIIAYQLAGSVMQVTGGGGGTQYLENNAVTPSVTGNAILYKKDETNSVLSTVSPQHPLPVQGSVTTLQGTNPWAISNPSVTAFQGGAWSTSVTGGYVNVIGSVALGVGNTSVTQAGAWNVNVNSILGTYQEKNAVTPSAIGIPILFKIDETNSVLSAISPQSPLPVRGSVTALQGTNPWIVVPTSGSIIATQIANSVMGVRTDAASVIAVLSNSSVTALQGTNPWVVNTPTPSLLSIQPGGSVMNVNVSGSVAARLMASSVTALQGTEPWVIGSIVGTYAEDAGHTTADKGLFTLAVRNDTISSFSSADADYTPHAVDSAGRVLMKPFAANEASIFGHASVVNGGDSGSVLVIAAAGTGLRNYITDWNVSNTGSVSTLITFTEGGGSIIGRTIAPAGGGSNMPGLMSPIRNQQTNQPINMVTTTASSVVYVAMYGHKAP